MCLGVFVVFDGITLACFELLGILFCAKILSHLILRSTFCTCNSESNVICVVL